MASPQQGRRKRVTIVNRIMTSGPGAHSVLATVGGQPILAIRGLHVEFDTNDGVVHAVKGVDFAKIEKRRDRLVCF